PILLARLVATTLIMTLQIPYGYYVIVTIFIVTQAHTGASIRKAGLRILGTLIGGGIGLFFLIATIDRPWVRIPLLGPLCAFFIFVSATTTAPYLGTLGGIPLALGLTAPGGTNVAGAHGEGPLPLAPPPPPPPTRHARPGPAVAGRPRRAAGGDARRGPACGRGLRQATSGGQRDAG